MLQKKLKPQQSPRLHAAFIDFSQAYDTVPRLQLRDHLQRIAMPTPLLCAIKEMYQDDGYILVDGDKRARVQCTLCTQQMEFSKVVLCLLSFFLYTSMTWADIEGNPQNLSNSPWLSTTGCAIRKNVTVTSNLPTPRQISCQHGNVR
eukprot:244440-Pelagomonas_calceolata.AAC.1